MALIGFGMIDCIVQLLGYALQYSTGKALVNPVSSVKQASELHWHDGVGPASSNQNGIIRGEGYTNFSTNFFW